MVFIKYHHGDQIKWDEMGGICSTNGRDERHACNILVGKAEGKRQLGRPRRRYKDNIKLDLTDTGWEGVDWIRLAKDREQWRALLNMAMNLRVP
jgi:hypothetical protein